MREAAVELNKYRRNDSPSCISNSNKSSGKYISENLSKNLDNRSNHSLTMNTNPQAKLCGTQLRLRRGLILEKKIKILSPIEERKVSPLINIKKYKFDKNSKMSPMVEVNHIKTPNATKIYGLKEHLKSKVRLLYLICNRKLRVNAK
jgi:hypothetical protein